jgi:hypothetical protein
MNILTQTNRALDGVTRRFGCRVTTLLAIPQHFLGLPLAPERAMEIIEAGRRIPEVILENSRAGTEEHWLINQAFNALGHPDLRGRQVGRMKGDRPVFWNSPGDWQYIIAHWVTLGSDGHFTLFDNTDQEIFDPWNPEEAVGVPGLPDNYVIRKRLVDKRLLYRVWRV